jgi:DNA-binding NarL/FixJ family response regulator
MVNIAIVDDHKLFVSALKSLIGNFFCNYHILFEASNGVDMIHKITPLFKPDIILLDLNMPVMNGYETLDWVAENYPEIRIIILSMAENGESVLKLIKSGIKGYLLKDAEAEEFKFALDAVCFGGVYFPKFVTQHLLQHFNKPVEEDSPQTKLNDRELAFLKLSATELTYKEIADRLCVSVRTVDGYRDHLFNKLNVKSRIGLAVYAIKNEICHI